MARTLLLINAMELPWVSEVEYLIKARCPLLHIQSYEEQRIILELQRLTQKLGHKLQLWSRTKGLRQLNGAVDQNSRDPLAALKQIDDSKDSCLFILTDFHSFLKDAAVCRTLRELNMSLKTSHKTVVLLSPVLIDIPELQKDLTVIDVPLPEAAEIHEVVQQIFSSIAYSPAEGELQQLTAAAIGLTQNEIENVIATSLVRNGRVDPRMVVGEKRAIVKKSGIMDFVELAASMDDVGGLEYLKQWLLRRQHGFTQAARDVNLPTPKGILMVGVPGCGKSLTARATASAWNLPLLRLDVGRIFAGIVGASENNMRTAIRTAEAVAPCILWIDEVEKAFAGARGGGAGDSGTSLRVLGTFLTWMQENKKPVFVVATANNISVLPPEFLRKGRFDEIFFVDLPHRRERLDIFNIVLRRFAWNLDDVREDEFLSCSEGFSGAEIEQALITARYEAFFHERPMLFTDVAEALRSTVSLLTTMQNEINELRSWAKSRTISASVPHDEGVRAVPSPVRALAMS